MKEYNISLPLGHISIPDAFYKVFSPDTLRKIHGEDMTITDWNEKRERTFRFYVETPGIPNEVKQFFCGSRLKITTKQSYTHQPTRVVVKNKVKLHVLGAELVSVRPTFTLDHFPEEKTTTLSVRIEHRARFPPPLNGIIENFMTETSKRAFQTFVNVVNN